MFKHLVYVTLRYQIGTDIQIYQIIRQENAYTALLPDPIWAVSRESFNGGSGTECSCHHLPLVPLLAYMLYCMHLIYIYITEFSHSILNLQSTAEILCFTHCASINLLYLLYI